MTHKLTIFGGESVFAGSAEVLRRGEQSLSILGSGSGSWGTGAKAATWVVEKMSSCWRAQSSWRFGALNDDLDSVVAQVPTHLRSDDFGWSFSLCCLLLSSSVVEYSAVGLFGIDIVTATASRQLYRPEMVIDRLVEAGRVEPAAAPQHSLADICTGPFFGDRDSPNMSKGEYKLSCNEALVVTELRQGVLVPNPVAIANSASAADLARQLYPKGRGCPTLLARAPQWREKDPM